MALRRIQDLSSYNLSIIKDIFIPVAALIGVSSYRVQKITPTQILNTVFDSISQTPIETIFVDAPSANILSISSNNLQVDSINSISVTALSVSTTSILANTGSYIDLKGVSISGYSLNANNLSVVSASGQDLSFNRISVAQLSANSITAINTSLIDVSALTLSALSVSSRALSFNNASGTQLSANNIYVNGYPSVARYSSIIYHTGSLVALDYTVQQPFDGLHIIAQLFRITSQGGLSSAEVVLASITNNGDKSFNVNILEPNDSIFQITFIG